MDNVSTVSLKKKKRLKWATGSGISIHLYGNGRGLKSRLYAFPSLVAPASSWTRCDDSEHVTVQTTEVCEGLIRESGGRTFGFSHGLNSVHTFPETEPTASFERNNH